MPKLLTVMNLRESVLIQTFFSEGYFSVLSGQFTFSSSAVIKDMNGRDQEGIC